MKLRGETDAPGSPGIPPRWTRGNKFGVGTAYSQDSKVWFTIWRGLVTEVYYPLADHPQVRDVQYVVSDHRSVVVEERKQVEERVERLDAHSLGYRIVNTDLEGRFTIEKQVFSDPHLPVVLIRTRFTPSPEWADRLQLYAMIEPHLDVGGWGNNGYVLEGVGRQVLAAERNGTWLVAGADVPLEYLSVGFAGFSDVLTELRRSGRPEGEYDRATNGNLALAARIDPGFAREFTLALAFGRGMSHATSALLQSQGESVAQHLRKFQTQWDRSCRGIREFGHLPPGVGRHYHTSYSLLLGHEDKTFAGAFPASLSIPWGNAKGDDERGGYHLVWTRDLVKTATGLLAAGDLRTPLRVLIYLAASQQPDGGFPQNFWLTGEPYWHGSQLDEVAFPILLADRLRRARALGSFDPYPMVAAAARYLLLNAPVTGQDRWEEVSGYSPSTLAAVITALIASATFARVRKDRISATMLEEYADFLESKVDSWTTTTCGTLHPDIARHYVRIRPADAGDPHPDEGGQLGRVRLPNLPPGEPNEFSADEVVDAGFLELVRYGIRRPDDPLVLDSLAVVDRALKVDTPHGPAWRRYTHDGYGQRADGGPFVGAGRGRPWPLLTGERGHFEVARGTGGVEELRALENFASPTGMIPEQVWDAPNRPDLHLYFGGPTGSAMPLLWAHSEYLALVRSVSDGKVFDLVPEVAKRYARRRRPRLGEVWTFGRQPREAPSGSVLRITAGVRYRIHWAIGSWDQPQDLDSSPSAIGVHCADLEMPEVGQKLVFTFYWAEGARWEGTDFEVRSV